MEVGGSHRASVSTPCPEGAPVPHRPVLGRWLGDGVLGSRCAHMGVPQGASVFTHPWLCWLCWWVWSSGEQVRSWGAPGSVIQGRWPPEKRGEMWAPMGTHWRGCGEGNGGPRSRSGHCRPEVISRSSFVSPSFLGSAQSCPCSPLCPILYPVWIVLPTAAGSPGLGVHGRGWGGLRPAWWTGPTFSSLCLGFWVSLWASHAVSVDPGVAA